MGTRGPLPGKGGRPTVTEQAKRKRSGAKANKKEFAAELSSLSFERVRELCGLWRPLEEQDEVVVALLWEAIKRHRALSEALSGFDPVQWTSGEPLSGLIRLDATEKQIATLAARFGMTPADRARLGEAAPAPKGASAFSQMVDRAQSILNN